MLNENIKALRKAKGMSQEALAVRLNVVRQTISKWEQGLSVPDSDMLISIAEVFETSASALLGEKLVHSKEDDTKALLAQLESINLQLAMTRNRRQRVMHGLFISLCLIILVAYICLSTMNSPYLSWDYSNPESAVIGVALHTFEWLFARLSPFVLAGAIIGAFLTRRKA